MPNLSNANLSKLEERIRTLCSEVLATKDEQQLRNVCAELRDAISEHIETVRIKVLELKLKELSSVKKLNGLSSPKE